MVQRATLEDLAESLRLGGKASADVDGLTQQRKDAMALQNQAMPEINKYGTVSPLAVMAQMVGASRGRGKMRGVDEGLTQARTAMNQAATDKTMYGAGVAADAAEEGIRQFDATEGGRNTRSANTIKAQRDAALKLAVAKEAQRGEDRRNLVNDNLTKHGWDLDASGEKIDAVKATRTRVPFHDPKEPKKTINYQKDVNGNWFDMANNPVDGALINNLTPWDTGATASKGYSGSGTGKISAKTILQHKETIRNVDSTYKAIKGMNEQEQADFNDPVNQAKVLAIKAMAPESFEALAESQFAGYPASTQKMLILLNKMSGAERNRLFGSALSKAELASSRTFLPAVMGKGLPWIVESLEAGKQSSADALYDTDTGQLAWLIENGIVDEGYTPSSTKLGTNPLAKKPEIMFPDDPAKQARFEAYEKRSKGL